MKVSVVMTTYNHEKFIARAIDGVLMQQTDFAYEIIICEDCSSDKTRSIVIDFHKKHLDKIHLILPAENLGNDGNSILVQGLQAAHGEYVALLDGDDYWTSASKLQKQVKFLEDHPHCSICFHNAMRVHQDGSRGPYPYTSAQQQPFSSFEDLLESNFIATCSVMLRKKAIQEIPDWYVTSIWGDWSLYLLAAQHGMVGYIDETMGVYRVHGGGLWSSLKLTQKLERDIHFYENTNANLNFLYDTTIKRLIAKRRFQLAVAHSNLPYDSLVLVVSQGDDELLNLDGRRAAHFPQNESGAYAGSDFGGSGELIGHLEALRAKGASYLIFPHAAFRWLNDRQGFEHHIALHYGCVWRDQNCIVYQLIGRTVIEVCDVSLQEAVFGQMWGYNIESPKPGRWPADHTFDIIGWVLGRSARAIAIELVSNGAVIKYVPLHLRRRDVEETYPHVPDPERCGFQTTLSLVSMVELEVVVRVVLQDQTRIPLGRIRAKRSWRDLHHEASMPLVSVIIPCYNQAHFLEEAIESVLAQSYLNFEVVVVDDGSTDNTQAVAARYPGVRCIQQQNQGLPAARNTGLRCSLGGYLVFLDADDRLLPQALETGLLYLEAHPEFACVAGHYQLIGTDGATLGQGPGHPVGDDHYLELLRINYIGMPATVMYRRLVLESLSGFNASLRASEDYDLYFRIARNHPVYYHGKLVGEYRQHGANMSSKAELMLKSTLIVHRSQWKYAKATKQFKSAYRAGRRFWQHAYGGQLVNQVCAHLSRSEWRQALGGAKVLLRYYPNGFVTLLQAVLRWGSQIHYTNPERCHEGDIEHTRTDWCTKG